MLNFFLYTHCPLLDFCHDASSPLFFRNQLLVCNVMHAIIVGKFVSKNFRDCWFYCTEYFKLRQIKGKFVCLNIISMALNMTHIPFPSTVCEYLLCSLTYWMVFLDRINSFIQKCINAHLSSFSYRYFSLGWYPNRPWRNKINSLISNHRKIICTNSSLSIDPQIRIQKKIGWDHFSLLSKAL